ncbi:MAG: ubiquinol-cytochrome c reductase iron-sulfur subunit, partial [Pseudomonadales bacterium]|nr:ubiquinol-cytochrome c reductase iron-sulfur subunit [Pseudomonadales bacterium]
MSTDSVNEGRRRFWIGATSAVGAAGAVGLAVPFVKSWSPSAKAKSAGAPVVADFSKLEPGQKMTVEWRGKPVWVVRRDDKALGTLGAVSGELRDAKSDESLQPDYAKNEHRSRKPEFLIIEGIC